MKPYHILLFSFVIITITACNESRRKSSYTDFPSYNRISINNNTVSETDKNILKKISHLPEVNLPFGSKLLIDVNLPSNWIQSTDEAGYAHPAIFESKMTKIVRSYDSIYESKSITLPQFSKTKFINFTSHNDSLFINDMKNFKFLCEYKYRLPNFGPYECYYQSLKFTSAYNEMFDLGKRYTDNYYIEYGNLVFYDTSSGLANILNIYNTSTGNERFGSDYKWFYIDKNKKIWLYRSGSDEGSGYFSLGETVTIKPDGKIVISKSPSFNPQNIK